MFVEQDGAGDGDFIIDAALGFEGFDLVMKERIFFAIFAAGGTGDDDDGGFFSIGAGNGIEDVEAADAVGHADQADAVDAGVGVGGEAGTGLVGHGDVRISICRARQKWQSEVAGDAEGVADAAAVKIFEKKLPHGMFAGKASRKRRGDCPRNHIKNNNA